MSSVGLNNATLTNIYDTVNSNKYSHKIWTMNRKQLTDQDFTLHNPYILHTLNVI